MITKILYGREKSLRLPNGEKRTAQYVIVDLDEIKASHNEETFADTIGYPVNELGRNINDRDYKRDTSAQQAVINIAENLDADKLIELTSSPSGTPIISPEGFVVSGNNRVMSLKLAAKKFPKQYDTYKNLLLYEIDVFGINKEKAEEQFNSPVLVRIDKDLPALNTTEMAKYNLSTRKGERPVDQAVKLSNILRENERCRNVIIAIVDGYETFSDLYGPNGKNDRKRLVQAFIDCGLVPETAMVSYYNDGEFTEGGKDFVENILSGMILTPDALNVAGSEGIKRFRQIIVSCLPVLITNENLKDASLKNAISEAVVIEYKARQAGGFSTYIKSQSMFGEDNFSEKGYVINRLLEQGRNRFKDSVKKYNDGVKSSSGNTMFAQETLSPDQVFDLTIRSQIPEAENKMIEQKFKKIKMETAVLDKPTTIKETETFANLWTNDAWFTEHPDKVLGVAYDTTGPYGPMKKYKGTINDIEKIEVPDNFIGNMKAENNPLASVVHSQTPHLDSVSPAMQEKIDQIIDNSKNEIDDKLLIKAKKQHKKKIFNPAVHTHDADNVKSFEEVYREINDQISKDELEVFIWWKSHTGKPLSRKWINLIHPGKYSAEHGFLSTTEKYDVPEQKITEWVKAGLLFYTSGNYEPAVVYLSGDVYDKKAQLQRDKEKIEQLYGHEVYEQQSQSFDIAFRKKYDHRLTLTGNNEGLVINPISKFVETFFVTGLEMKAEQGFKIKAIGTARGKGKPDFENDERANSWKKQEYEKLSLKNAFEYWLFKGNPELKEPVTVQEIVKHYLDGGPIRNQFSKEENPGAYEVERTKIEKLKASLQREGERLFLEFLHDQLTAEDKIRLENQWNADFNNYLPIDYNKVPVAWTMCRNYKGKPETIKPEKREAVASAMIEGSLCLSYDVGVGKTPSAIFTISAFLDAGFCQRPFICTPNQVYKQFISEIKAFAPHIPVNEGYNFGGEYAENFKNEKGQITKVAAGTITVITYEGLEQVGFNEHTSSNIFAELYSILNQGGEDERVKTAKQKEGFMEKLETLIGKGLRGTLYNIEDFGFDFGCYDEAHKMKKVFTAVKGDAEVNEDGKKERGRNPYQINSGVPSSIALKGFMLNFYIQKNNNWQNVLLLTATPFTNSPLEIFSMLSMIAYNKLRQTSINNIKSFFDTYIRTSTELVINSRLKPQMKQVILGFNNLLPLQTLIRRFINYKTGEQVNVQRPKKYVLPYLKKIDNGTTISLGENEKVETYIGMTPTMTAMMNDIVKYAEGSLDLKEMAMSAAADNEQDSDDDSSDKSEGVELNFNTLSDDEKKGVRIIRGITWSRNLALSPYLYEYSGLRNPSAKEYIESSPKLRYVIESIRTVKEYHEKKKEPISGQVIYMDRGISFFSQIKEYLIKFLGYQPHEIGVIKSGLPKNGKLSKEHVKNLFNGEVYNEDTKLFEPVPDEQRIKIIIGSSTIKEGINLQRYGTVLYNCFIDWNPTDVQQLEGRIWRQGNTFNAVRIVNPLVIDSADIFMFQKLQEKTSRLNNIWATDGRKNVMNTDDFNPEELKYALIRDPMVVAELKVKDDITRLESEKLGQQRLIDNAEKTKKLINTITYHLDDAAEAVKEYREFEKSSSILSDAERLVKLVIDIEKKQTDIQGRKMINKYDAEELRKKNKWDDKKFVITGYGYGELRSFDRPYWFSEFALAVREFLKMYSTFLAPFKIDVSPENTASLDKFSEHVKTKMADMDNEKKRLESEDHIKVLAAEIVKERQEKKIEYKSLTQVVKDFTRLNYLLSEKKLEIKEENKKPATCPPMENGIRLINEESIRQINVCLEQQHETKTLHTVDGVYTNSRKLLHTKIIKELFEHVHCIKNKEPLAIFTGGAPGSGKSNYLKKIPWLMNKKGEINSNIFKIDADSIREKLPEYEGWNSAITHKETGDIVNSILGELGEGSCRYDFLYDGTMHNAKKYFPLINRVKQMGYKTFIIFMNVPYTISMQRTLNRYQKDGRYVPTAVIDDFFTVLPDTDKTKGMSAFEELKRLVDGYIVVNGVTGEIEDSKGDNLPKKRYYSPDPVSFEKPMPAPVPKPEPAKPQPVKANKEAIQSQIKALSIAAKYATDKVPIEKTIKALSIALKYAS